MEVKSHKPVLVTFQCYSACRCGKTFLEIKILPGTTFGECKNLISQELKMGGNRIRDFCYVNVKSDFIRPQNQNDVLTHWGGCGKFPLNVRGDYKKMFCLHYDCFKDHEEHKEEIRVFEKGITCVKYIPANGNPSIRWLLAEYGWSEMNLDGISLLDPDYIDQGCLDILRMWPTKINYYFTAEK
jgi:hypothetical protein